MQKLLTILLILFSFPVYAGIKINNWNEEISLTNDGKNSQVEIVAQINGLQKNQYYKNFGFSFDSRQKITIKNVQIDNRNASYSFQNNRLDITFPSQKANNSKAVINFSYSEKYDKINQYLRRETIYVPPFASGALANVEVSYPWSLRSATLNKNIKEFNKKFIYQGLVPKNGVREIVKLTNARNSWYVKIKNPISIRGNVLDLEAIIPKYFLSGGQQQYGYVITSDTTAKVEQEVGQNIFKFKNLKDQNINIQIEAEIRTGENNDFSANKNPADYLTISDADRLLLAPMLREIQQDPNLQGLPLYAKIGEYVHNYIKYEKDMTGQLPSLNQIVSGKAGVCTEYAKLFNALSRAAQIPSIVVAGVANGEYNGFEGHAWNLIYYNNKWIYVDPTWDLMSGIVSSSHIYFHDDTPSSIKIKWKAIKGAGMVDIDSGDNNFEVKKIW